MKTVQYILLICILILSYAYAFQFEPQLKHPSKPKCNPSDCINIFQCKQVTDMIRSAPKPLSADIKKQLWSLQCGRDRRTVRVCCPKQPKLGIMGDLTKHPNYNLIPNRCGLVNYDNKLLGGKLAGLFEFPWMVLFFYRLARGRIDPQCAGTIINDRYILTAAHCIAQLQGKSLSGVRIGEYNISSSIDCEEIEGTEYCADPAQDMEIEEVIPHPQYNASTFKHDIGLLRLKNKIRFKDNIAPICLPISANLKDASPKYFTISGWGRTDKSYFSNVLLKINVPLLPQRACAKAYRRIVSITDRQICAGNGITKNSCEGDSGGPMQAVMNFNDDARFVQYGLVSFGPEMCNGIPAVYTKIPSYLDWILDNIKP